MNLTAETCTGSPMPKARYCGICGRANREHQVLAYVPHFVPILLRAARQKVSGCGARQAGENGFGLIWINRPEAAATSIDGVGEIRGRTAVDGLK